MSSTLLDTDGLAELHRLLEQVAVRVDRVCDRDGRVVEVLDPHLRARLDRAIEDIRDAWLEALRRETV